jgi:hypothetical protein
VGYKTSCFGRSDLTQSRDVLWIHGIPGKEKTVLAISLIDTITGTQSGQALWSLWPHSSMIGTSAVGPNAADPVMCDLYRWCGLAVLS